jgi:hypothetical protein
MSQQQLTDSVVPIEPFTSARDFVTRLVALEEKFEKPLFRGQKEAKWDLCPSAWRHNNDQQTAYIHKLAHHYATVNADDIHYYLCQQPGFTTQDVSQYCWAWAFQCAESELIRDFVILADQAGHHVLGREKYRFRRGSTAAEWMGELEHRPGPLFYPAPDSTIAMAQHYGVPTRLLDWTRNPYYAALFAAFEVTETSHEEPVAVWALDAAALANARVPAEQRFQIADLWEADNQFLRAQEAVLLYAPMACLHYGKNGRWPRIEDSFSSDQRQTLSPALIQLTLPATEVPPLIDLLEARRVTIAKLMPSLNTVAKALTARWRWVGHNSQNAKRHR